MKLKVDGETIEPWGALDRPIDANVNKHALGGRDVEDEIDTPTYVLPDTYPASSAVTVIAQSWLKNNPSLSGDDNDHWYSQRVVDSSTHSQQLIVLRDGDPVPNIAPFLNQPSAAAFLQEHIDFNTNTIRLGPNQALYLFEMGTTNLHSSAANFQDFAVLLTLAKTPSQAGDLSYPPRSYLIKVDTATGDTTRLMGLSNLYDGLACTSAQTFYACQGSELYELDPVANTESFIATIARSNMQALEFAGHQLFRFSASNHKLRALDTTTGAHRGGEISTGMTHLSSMIFMRLADSPIGSVSYR